MKRTNKNTVKKTKATAPRHHHHHHHHKPPDPSSPPPEAESAPEQPNLPATRSDPNNGVLERENTCVTGAPREIFRRLGLGEEEVGAVLRELLHHDNPRVRLQAANLITKCLGLQRDVLEVQEAPVIVITGQGEQEDDGQDEGQDDDLVVEV